MLAGTFINAVLYGVSITQVYIYVKTFRTLVILLQSSRGIDDDMSLHRTDKQWIKGFVRAFVRRIGF